MSLKNFAASIIIIFCCFFNFRSNAQNHEIKIKNLVFSISTSAQIIESSTDRCRVLSNSGLGLYDMQFDLGTASTVQGSLLNAKDFSVQVYLMDTESGLPLLMDYIYHRSGPFIVRPGVIMLPVLQGFDRSEVLFRKGYDLRIIVFDQKTLEDYFDYTVLF